MRKAILVLGMHRSGTSALAGALVRAGAAAPKTLMEANVANERGYFESLPFMVLHDEILAAAGTSWRDWRSVPRNWRASAEAASFRSRATALLGEEFGMAPLFVLKDPRICRFVPFWLSVLKDAGIAPLVVIPFRRPLEVAQSHKARDGMSREEGLLIWLSHVLDAERETRGLPRSIVAMDDLLGDWRATLARIGRELGLVWPSLDDAAAKSIDAFLSTDLKHHTEIVDSRIDGWASRAYEALRVLTIDPMSRLAQAALGVVAAEFEQACSLFAPLVAGLDEQASQLRSSVKSEPTAAEIPAALALAAFPDPGDTLRTVRIRLELLQVQLSAAGPGRPKAKSARRGPKAGAHTVADR